MNILIGILITFLVVVLVLYLVDRIPLDGRTRQIVRIAEPVIAPPHLAARTGFARAYERKIELDRRVESAGHLDASTEIAEVADDAIDRWPMRVEIDARRFQAGKPRGASAIEH
jgi:hypothetical protein